MHLNNSLRKTPVAVIGLSAMFADARNVEEFWTNIILGKDSITDVPESRWRIEDYYDPDMTAPDKTYCKRGGFLPGIDFNPMEFGLPPNILEVTDASQLLGLVAARDALLDAGYAPASEKFAAALRSKTGVVLGVGGGQKLITPLIARLQYPIWESALRASGIAEEDIPPIVDKMKKAYVSWNENAFPGLLGNVISGRIANRFDLGGINSVVDAACAASLSAIKMALSELLEGRADMMLTGGVDTDNSPFMYMSFSKTPAFSKSGAIRPFSQSADGMLIGEGLGILVLRRLEDAERDGDHIYAVIKGIGTSSDGRFNSVYAPRAAGQALAMQRAYDEAGYDPSTVGLVEAHGTGTGTGDPVEFDSMRMVFGKDNPEKQHIALGSVKSQIGHTKAAAGAAGMLKAVLALHHKILPPTINVDRPNPIFSIEDTPLYLNTETRPWLRSAPDPSTPRRASVSAFGFGGINVHITLEEYTGRKSQAYRFHEPYKTIFLQAPSPEALLNACETHLQQLREKPVDIFNQIVKSSKSILPQRSAARLGFVASSVEDCIDLLHHAIETLKSRQTPWDHPKGIYYRPEGVDPDAENVVALFSGQGSQYVGMGRELANAFPEVQEAFFRMDTLLREAGELPLSGKVFPNPVFSEEERIVQQTALTQTQIAQPAIGTLSMAMYSVLQKAGFKPHFAAGHSFGEITALWAAGVIDEDTYLMLARSRGKAMAASNGSGDRGAMLAVKASETQVTESIADVTEVYIANINSHDQVVLGGSTESIVKVADALKAQGVQVAMLPVSAAFHTRHVAHACKPFAQLVQKQKFYKPAIPVYANAHAKPYPAGARKQQELLSTQILNPVLFRDMIENIYDAGGRIFVEFGPRDVITQLVKNILQNKEHIAIALNPSAHKDSDLQLRQAALQLRVLGLPMSHIDPYKRDLHPGPPKTAMDVVLSGNNYVSTATQEAYRASLNDGFRIAPVIEEKVRVVEKFIEVPAQHGTSAHLENGEETMNPEALKILQEALASFNARQTKSLEIFERFFSEQHQQTQYLLELLSQQINTARPQTPTVDHAVIPAPVMPKKTVSKPITQEVHLSGNGSPTNGSSKVRSVDTPAPVAPVANRPPVPTTTTITGAETLPPSQLADILLNVVSEKTGYPAEMLDLSMDLEADLGIDSIKRVEIFGALTAQYAGMEGIDPAALTELRTLGQIIDFVQGTKSAQVSTPASSHVRKEADSVATETRASNSENTLEGLLLSVVSEKTGYPAEMLDLHMDLEADLGIDSIKRVEIFGALTAEYPDMSGIDPAALTELRTLAQIVEYVDKVSKKKLPA